MIWVRFGSLFMFLGVALGAFGAHALKTKLSPEFLTIFETGVRYQFYHALALFIVAWLYQKNPGSLINVAGWSFVGGILVFSGSLYILCLTGVKAWGAVTPIGGLSFLVGWALLFISSCL